MSTEVNGKKFVMSYSCGKDSTLALHKAIAAGGIPMALLVMFNPDSGRSFFHGANEGTKYDLIQADNRASFEMDCKHRLVTNNEIGNCTMEYESVVGQGTIHILSDEEKYDALCILMNHYHKEGFPFNKAIMPQTTVYKLVVENMTGKRRMVK